MAIKRGNKYYCSVCDKEFINPVQADIHRDTEHEIIYVPFSKEELHRLIMFLELRDPSVLTRNIVTTLKKYHKAANTPKPQEDLNAER